MRKGVIDMGTNSMRLAIADVTDNNIVMIYNEVAETRLGEGMGASEVIQAEPMARNLQQLKLFLRKMEEYAVDERRVIATSAVRDAKNQKDFIDAIKAECDIVLEVLPGETEARLSYNGARKDFEGTDNAIVVLDIGGGSTELVYPVNETLHGASVNVGAVRLLEQQTRKEELMQRLEKLLQDDFPQPCHLIAVGGTNTCLAALEQGLVQYNPEKIHGFVMNKQTVDVWYQRLMDMSLEERIELPGMKKKRADIMPYGVMILKRIMELTGVESVQVSDKGLVYGLLAD